MEILSVKGGYKNSTTYQETLAAAYGVRALDVEEVSILKRVIVTLLSDEISVENGAQGEVVVDIKLYRV